MLLLSVIVPVYKTEKFINRCIDSILSQTYSNLEILLIDDGSPDQCPSICDEYAKKDRRVKVLHKLNEGVSAARNSGLDMASGDYIGVIDSDDYIEPEMYQSMMDIAVRYNCDVVMCDCVKEFLDHTEIYTHDIRAGYYDRKQLREEYFPHLLMMENVEYPPTISNTVCLFRVKENERNRLRYVEGVRFSEDLLFGAQMLYQADSFYYMKEKTFYHYCMNSDSVTHTFCENKWEDYLKLYAETERYFMNCENYDFRHQIDLMLLFFVYNVINGIIGFNQISNREKLRRIGEILKNKKTKEMFSRISIIELPIGLKLKIVTFCYKYRIGIRILIGFWNLEFTDQIHRLNEP